MTLYEEMTSEASNDLTHAVDILAFVEAQEIPAAYFDTPYYLAPVPGGEKDYATLRETLRRNHKVGIAYVVIQARQHLAALIPSGQSLVLNTLRWNAEGARKMPEAEGRGSNGSLLETDWSGILAGPASLQSGLAPPLQQMRVTGCNDSESIDLSDFLDEELFYSDEVLTAILGRRLHRPIPHAGRSTAPRKSRSPAAARRLVRRA